jgi:hypothetical protein
VVRAPACRPIKPERCPPATKRRPRAIIRAPEAWRNPRQWRWEKKMTNGASAPHFRLVGRRPSPPSLTPPQLLMPATRPRRLSSKQVVAFDRNAWPRSIRLPGRNLGTRISASFIRSRSARRIASADRSGSCDDIASELLVDDQRRRRALSVIAVFLFCAAASSWLRGHSAAGLAARGEGNCDCDLKTLLSSDHRGRDSDAHLDALEIPASNVNADDLHRLGCVRQLN